MPAKVHKFFGETSYYIAKLILSILQALGKVDTSINFHSLIAKLHCIAFLRKLKEVENG
jgi:hypothetical protein